ncbi:MAG: hypothetical protein M3O70_15775 [Actinomycetota bacterium]|nr:hypothetical protein [Actinomycetota bacterium]
MVSLSQAAGRLIEEDDVDVKAPPELRKVMDDLASELARLRLLYAEIHDEAYGPRRSGEPVPGAGGSGQTSDPTGAEPTARQRQLRDHLASVSAGLTEARDKCRAFNRKHGRPAQRHDAGAPAGPPT